MTRAYFASLAIAPPGYKGTPPPAGAGGTCSRCQRPLYAYENTITDQATGLLCCMPCLGLRPGDPCPCGCGDPVVCPDIPAPAAPNTGGSGGEDGRRGGGGGGGLLMQPGFMEWMADRMAMPDGRPDIAERRANAAAENRKASAPCESCGRDMPAAGRCDECRANGVWYCAPCHDRLADLARRKRNAGAESQKSVSLCDGCARVMREGDRCDDCRATGLWICAVCHVDLIRLAGIRAAGRAAGAAAPA